MDGAAYASQCPISKYSTFKYVFKAEYEGSYWYHSHNGIQRMDGLFGGLTIYDPGKLPEVIHSSTILVIFKNFHKFSLLINVFSSRTSKCS